MGNRNLKAIGGVSTIVGTAVTIFGVVKYNSAGDMYRASSYFGENKSSDIWSDYMSNYKIIIIVGAIVLLIGMIILLSGFFGSGENEIKEVKPNSSVSQKLSELQKMKEDNLITQEEFDEKRKQILDSM